MRKALILLPLALAACANFPSREERAAAYHHQMDCAKQVGPQPHTEANIFGLAGALYRESQPDWQAWNAAFEACVKS
jgi:hypothetical protein